jgi:hypothetical protein
MRSVLPLWTAGAGVDGGDGKDGETIAVCDHWRSDQLGGAGNDRAVEAWPSEGQPETVAEKSGDKRRMTIVAAVHSEPGTDWSLSCKACADRLVMYPVYNECHKCGGTGIWGTHLCPKDHNHPMASGYLDVELGYNAR